MIRIEKILYPTDFSSYSNQAYFHAIALAENHRASLTVLFVYTPDMITPGSEGDEDADRRYWQNQLEQIRPVDPGITVRHVFLEGDPAEEIVRYGRDAGADVIVMGTHGRTGLERLLMGSVAERGTARRPVFRAGGQAAQGPAVHGARRRGSGGRPGVTPRREAVRSEEGGVRRKDRPRWLVFSLHSPLLTPHCVLRVTGTRAPDAAGRALRAAGPRPCSVPGRGRRPRRRGAPASSRR